jgi:hypothetical protein
VRTILLFALLLVLVSLLASPPCYNSASDQSAAVRAAREEYELEAKLLNDMATNGTSQTRLDEQLRIMERAERKYLDLKR